MPWPTDPAGEFFGRGGWGWDGTAWRKLSLLWGYSDRWAEDLGGVKSGAGTYSAWSSVVPAGEVWVLEFLSAHNNTTNPSFVALYVNNGTFTAVPGFKALPGVSVPTYFSGRLTLKAGDKAGFDMGGCLNLDNITGSVWGYRMAVG